jgi:hypothetical protein
MKTLASGGIFPSPGAAPFSLPLTALMTIGGQLYGAATVFELVSGADPYFSNFNANGTNVFYLSEDLRVFTVTPGIQNNPLFGIPLLPSSNTDYDSGAAYNYIEALLAVLNANNADATGADVFTSFPDQTSAFTADSSVSPSSVNPADPTGTRFSNYSFAVARVRLDGTPASSTIKNVRVFFRLFASQSADTDFAPDWTYPSTTNAGLPTAPLVGLGNPPVTIPFFATGNYESNSDHPINVDYSANSANNLPITITASGKTWAYFGCYLNVYPTGNTINGNSISSMLPGSHHCLIAQIAFDDAPIVNSNGTTETPENSDKLAQRNLEVTYSDNPGPASTHRIPQTFDTRRSVALSAVSGDLTDYPDEIMIDWGNTPVGSAAHVYWPQVAASDVLTLAKRLYSTHQLSALDANTVHCKVPHGFTYIPIPPGTGDNYAGLFTVDLPPGIVSGQVFTVTVRRISTRRAEIIESRPPAGPHIGGGAGGSSAGTGGGISISALATKSVDDALALVKAISVGPTKKVVNWRYVTGSFAVRIPVTVPKIMLPIEEDTLAIMKWRLTQMSPSNRWYPVLVVTSPTLVAASTVSAAVPSRFFPTLTAFRQNTAHNRVLVHVPIRARIPAIPSVCTTTASDSPAKSCPSHTIASAISPASSSKLKTAANTPSSRANAKSNRSPAPHGLTAWSSPSSSTRTTCIGRSRLRSAAHRVRSSNRSPRTLWGFRLVESPTGQPVNCNAMHGPFLIH